MKTKFHPLAAAFIAALVFLTGARAQVAPVPDPDKFTLRLGTFFLSGINTKLTLTDALGHGGQEVDFRRDLGGRDSLNLFRVDAEWQFATKHKVEFSYFDIDQTASKVISTTINWGDQTFPVNTTIQARYQTIICKLNYGYTFYRNDARTQEINGLIGFHITEMKASLSATFTNVAEGASITAPLPVLGLEWKARLSDQLTSHVAYEYFGLSLDNKYTGNLSDFQAMLEYQLSRHWSLGAGYNRFTSRATVTSGRAPNGQQLKLSAVHNYNGLMLFVATHF